MSDAFAALGDPTRRRILEVISHGEQAVGAIVEELRATAPISQPAVSQHLKLLVAAGLATFRAEGTRRYYAVDPTGFEVILGWLAHIADPLAAFGQPLDALSTEVARGKRTRRAGSQDTTGESRSA